MKSERRQYIYLIAGVLIVALAILLVLFYTSYHKGWDRFPGSVHKVSQSVVIIRVLNIDSTSSPICTGFVVDKRGYIVTAKHCFETITNDINYRLNASYSISEVIDKIGLAEIKVGENTAHSGITLVQNDNLELKDVILIKLKDIPQFELLPVRIATKEELTQIGIEIGFVGYTEADDNMSDFEIFIGKGILSNVKLDLPGRREPYYSIQTLATGGFSGGPVFLGRNGNVFGIISSGRLDSEGKSGIVYVPPIHEIKKIID